MHLRLLPSQLGQEHGMLVAWQRYSVKELLQLGADALIEEHAGRTARKCAMAQKHKKIVKLLGEAEATLEAGENRAEGRPSLLQ